MGATSKQSNKPAWYNEESNKRHNEWLAKKERIRKLTQENFARYKQQKEEEKKKASSVTGSKSTYQPAGRPDTVQQTPKRDYHQLQVSMQNIGRPELAYQVKMMDDTKGAWEREKQREQQRQAAYEQQYRDYNSQANDSWKDVQVSAQNAGAPQAAYAYKMIYDTAGTTDDKKKKWNDFLNTLGQARQQKQPAEEQPQSVRPAVMSRDEEIRKRFEDSQAGRRNDAAQAAASGMMGVPAGASPMIRSGEELQDAYLQSQGIDPAAAKAAQGAATAAGQAAQKKQLLDPKSGKPLAQQYQDILGARNVASGNIRYGTWLNRSGEFTEAMRPETAAKNTELLATMRKAGYFDGQPDMNWWSTEKRNAVKTNYEQTIQAYQDRIAQLDSQADAEQQMQGDFVSTWGNIADYVTELQIKKLRAKIDEVHEGTGWAREYHDQIAKLQKEREQTRAAAAQKAEEYYSSWLLGSEKNRRTYHEGKALAEGMSDCGPILGIDYDSLTEDMTEEERDTLDYMLRQAVTGNNATEKRDKESAIRSMQKQLQQLDALDEEDRQVSELLSGIELGDTAYHAEKKYAGINHGKTAASILYNVLGGENPAGANMVEKELYQDAVLLEPEMKDAIISLYNEEKYDDALAVYEALKPFREEAWSMYEKMGNREFASELPVTASLASVGATLYQPLEFLGNIPGYADALINGTQNEQTRANSDAYAVTRFKNDVRGKIAEDLGDNGWIYNSIMSGVDCYANMMALGGAGVSKDAMQAATLALFSTQAFEASLQNNLEQNHGSFAYDIIEAAVDAAIETATEKWSVENMLGDPTNILQYVGKMALSESSEEVVGAIVEPYIKEMIGHKNQWKERADDIYAAGGYTDKDGRWIQVDNIDEATKQAMREWNHEIRMSAQSALVSIAPSAVYATGANMINSQQIANMGKNINEYKQGQMNFTPEGMQSPQARMEGKLNLNGMSQGAGELVEQGLQAKTGSEAYQQAKKISDAAFFGKKIRNLDVGKLGVALRQQIGQNAEEQGAEARQQLIADRLEETDEEKKAELSRIVDKASREGLDALTRKEQKLLKKNPGAFSVYEELTAEERNETQAEMETAEREATKDSSENLKKVDRIALVNNKYVNQMREKLQESEAKTDAGQKLATQEEIDRASGKRTGAQNEAIVYTDENPEGAVAQLDGIEKVKDGNRTKVMFRVTVDGKTQLMDPTEVKATNFATAAMLQQSVTKQGVFSDKFMNSLMELQKKGRVENVGSFLRDATRIRFAAYIGESVPFTDMPEEVAKDLWLQSVNEAKEQREAEVQKGTGRTKGKATYQGAEYGTEAWNKKIKEQLKSGEMNRQQAQQIDAIAGIAQRAGIEVNFRTAEEIAELEGITAEEAQKIYGSQSGSTININLDAKDYSLDENNPDQPKVSGKHHMLVTFGHEFTHWLQENSLQGYNQLRNFVIEEQKSRGVNVPERLMTIMDNWGQNTDLDINGAIAEMVANSCDQILGNEEVARRLQETKPKLYEQIRNFVADLVDRIKSVKADMSSSASRDSWYMMAASANRMAKVWLGAYDEALGRETQGQKAQADNQAYSMSELTEKDKAYADAVERGDMQAATDMLMEKLEHSENIIPYNAPHGYAGQHVDIAQMIKNGTPEAVARAAADMATYVPDNGVLVPMPNHHGVVNADTDTMILANAISEITGRPVINALEGAERESRFAAKQSGRQGAGAEELGFRQVQEIPEGTIPIFIDNVVGTGVTAQAAEAALGGGVTLAYAKSTRSKGIQGLKQATVTYDRDGNLIPLSQRFDASVRDTRYSIVDTNGNTVNLTEQDIENNKRTISEMDPVANITENRFKKNQNKDFKTMAMEYFGEDGTTAKNKILGDVNVGRYGIEHLISYLTEKKAGMLEAAIPVIENGEIIDIQEKGNTHNFDSAIIAAPITYMGDKYYMGVVITQDGERQNKYYMHDAVIAKTIEGLTSVKSLPSQTLEGHPSIKSILNTIPKNNVQNGNAEQFSMAEPIEQTKDLIAVHNLTEQNLLDTLAEGGFTAPSIAVIKAKTGHSKFGTISVIFNRDTIDPKKGSKNKIYGTDAWTPTRSNAQIETKLDYKVLQQARDTIMALTKEGNTANLWHYDAMNWINQWLYEDQTTDDIDEMIRRAYNNDGMIAAYQTAKGNEIEQKTVKEKKHSDLRAESVSMYNDFLNTLEKNNMLQEFMNDMKEMTGFGITEKYADIFGSSSEEAANIVEKFRENPDGLARRVMLAKMKQARWFQEDGRQIIENEVFDKGETASYLRRNTNKQDFGEWIREMIGGALGKRGIYNGKEMFTASGSKRSFEALHMEPTAENIVKAMYINHEAKGGEAGGATGLMAKASKEYRNINEVRADKGRLQQLGEEEYKAKVEALDDELRDFSTRAQEATGWNMYEIRQMLIEAGGEYAKGGMNAVRRYFRTQQVNLTEELMNEAISLMDEAREIPTGYFEAKPERVVGLDEIAKVIVPEKDQEVIDRLDEMGIPYVTYDGTEEDRLEKLNEQESSKFSVAEPNMDVANWMEGLTPGSLRTESERQLLQAYKDLRMKIRMSEKRQEDYLAEIRKLEARQQLDAEDRDRLTELRNKLQVQQEKQARLEEELYDVTSSEGYAGMMHYTHKTLQDNVLGKNQAQVQAAVDTMVSQAEAAKKNLEKQEKKLKQMADTAEIRTAKGLMRKLGLQGIAKDIKGQLNTTMSQTEIENRMAEIALRQLKGENVQDDITALAEEIMTTQAGYGNEEAADILRRVRGRTIVIGPAQQAEMKGQHVSLKDIREMTKGSGVKFEYGDTATLSGSGLSELLDEMPELRTSQAYGEEMQNETSNVIAFANYIQDKVQERRGSTAAEGTLDRDMVELTLQSLSNILAGGQNGEQTARQMLETINSKRGEAETALESIREMKESIDATLTAGKKANMWAQALTKDLDSTIEYFNKTAKWAAEVERQKVRENVIETLKSENTRKLIAQQEKYEQLIKNDRTARGLHEDNESLRRQIHTVAGRVKNLLTAETDEKNIQEEAKPLARFMAGLILRHDANGFRRVTYANRKQLEDAIMRLDKLDAQAEPFDVDRDLDWAVIKAQNPADNDYTLRDKLVQDLIDIETGLLEYRQAEGRGTLTLQDRKAALQKVQKAAAEIWGAIKARSEAHIAGQKYNVFELAEALNEDAEKSTFKGERKGFGSKSLDAFWNAVGYGNLTPEYFIKNLKNRAMTLLHKGMQDAEQRGGLEARKAQRRIEQIAKDTGYATWDGQEKHEVRLENGRTVTMTTEQIMALYATWKRESNALRPEETSHLLSSGFVLAENGQGEGKYRRERSEQKPVRVKEGDLNSLGGYLTDNQRAFVDAIVDYMSGDLAQLGNEASLKTYGIKKFTEKYYFPIKSWEGVLNKSSASGTSRMNDNRAMRQSFTKRIINNANNAVEISDFTPTAMKHIVGMINFNTVGPAVENLNKVLNQQLEFGEVKRNGAQLPTDGGIEDETYKRNMRMVFAEKYGTAALKYLEQFMQDINGGVSKKTELNLFDKLLSMFKKNAVAGSLSVAAQQPLSYIRAAMMINPKYLAQAILPQYWKGSYQEMMDHSGIAVIKEMGRFDMNFGRSMQDYITPEALESKGRKVWNGISDAATSLPQKTDAMTWTRMWSACKLEQAALHPEMDTKSEEFMKLVTERFNDLMRRTQVYDSVMVKSQNMRDTQDWRKKIITSFMAEPTLSLNVLADAWMNLKEKGGKANAAKALATFLLSAAAQAGAKAFFGAGRSPKKEKNREENFLNKFAQNLISEANPLGLIPGYSQLSEAFINGEANDDAMGVIGKAKEAADKILALVRGDVGNKGLYRDLEDSLGQMVQYATQIPLKNFMRDFRAMVNWFSGGKAQDFTGDTYAQRETSGAVLKYQTLETLFTQEIGGLINAMMGEAGFKTTNDAYFERLYKAQRAGRQEEYEQLREFLRLTKVKSEDPDKTINSALNKLTKGDDDLSAEEKTDAIIENSTDKAGYNYVIEQLKGGELTAEQAREKIKEIYPDKSDNDIWWSVDRAQYAKETGETVSGNYYRLKDAVDSNRSAEIRQAVDDLVKHGVDREKIKKKMSDWKSDYLAADSKGKTRIRNAIQLVYKQLGYTAEDADKMINKWKK